MEALYTRQNVMKPKAYSIKEHTELSWALKCFFMSQLELYSCRLKTSIQERRGKHFKLNNKASASLKLKVTGKKTKIRTMDK